MYIKMIEKKRSIISNFFMYNEIYVGIFMFFFKILQFNQETKTILSKQQIEEIVINNERAIKHLSGKTPKKIIVVPGKIVNIVI